VWTHPTAATTEYRDGGWSYDALRKNAGSLFTQDTLQGYGEEFLPLPAELQPESRPVQPEAAQVR
jgi:hypothetical protein